MLTLLELSRKYKEEEIPILLEIWEQASAKAHPFLDSEFTNIVRNAMNEIYLPNSDTWVYEEEGKIVGFISMLKNGHYWEVCQRFRGNFKFIKNNDLCKS